MKIAVLTYDNPHRKTQDVLLGLKAHGYTDVTAIASPWVARKSFVPIYKHRPSKAMNIALEAFCANLGVKLMKSEIEGFEHILEIEQFDRILIAGAGLLPAHLPHKFKIINSHPAYLPLVRGLDALKWAIHQDLTIGVTTHYISDKADEGLLIERNIVPLYYEDSFHSLAYRQYEMEIEMLINAVQKVDEITDWIDLADDKYEAHRRMPHQLEVQMMERFQQLRLQSPSFKAVD